MDLYFRVLHILFHCNPFILLFWIWINLLINWLILINLLILLLLALFSFKYNPSWLLQGTHCTCFFFLSLFMYLCSHRPLRFGRVSRAFSVANFVVFSSHIFVAGGRSSIWPTAWWLAGMCVRLCVCNDPNQASRHTWRGCGSCCAQVYKYKQKNTNKTPTKCGRNRAVVHIYTYISMLKWFSLRDFPTHSQLPPDFFSFW